MISFFNMSSAATNLTILNPKYKDFNKAKYLN